jgi:hypothetical protein
MGTFAERAIVDYCLTFADQGKQMTVFCFPLQQTQKLLFSVSWFSIRGIPEWKHRHEGMKIKTWGHGDMDMETSNGKQKTKAQTIFLTLCLSFAHHAKGSFSLV